eukprot:08034.XXX_407221_407442_1 [CDS] Oithona nana genome sequencing.
MVVISSTSLPSYSFWYFSYAFVNLSFSLMFSFTSALILGNAEVKKINKDKVSRIKANMAKIALFLKHILSKIL